MLIVRKTAFARQLRRDQTAVEEWLWSHLRGRRLGGFKFRRQAPLDRYVVDFLSTEAKLVVEVDGPSHEASNAQDQERDRALEGMGYLVMRFNNGDVFDNIEGVLDEIFSTLQQRGLRDV